MPDKNPARLLEQLVEDYLLAANLGQVENAGKFRTSTPGDGGMDFLLTTRNALPSDACIFGLPLLCGKKYAIEVKYTDGVIDLDRVAPNLFQISSLRDIHAAILVTNAHSTPTAYYDILRGMGQDATRFILVDGLAMKEWMRTVGVNWPEDIQEPKDFAEPLIDGLYLESFFRRLEPISGGEWHLSFFNRTSSPRAVQVNSCNDITWTIGDGWAIDKHRNIAESIASTPGFSIAALVIPPWRSETIKLWVKPNGYRLLKPGSYDATQGSADDGTTGKAVVSPPLLTCASGRQIAILTPEERLSVDVSFRPDLVGGDHVRAVQTIKDAIANDQQKPCMFFLHGPAGTGKSRIIGDAMPEESVSNYCVVHLTVGQNGTVRLPSLSEPLSKLFRSRPAWAANLDLTAPEAVAYLCHKDLVQRRNVTLILVIEDLHQVAPDPGAKSQGQSPLVEALKTLTQNTDQLHPSTVILLSARDDYRDEAGPFRDWCEFIERCESRHRDLVHIMSVAPLDEQDAETLVRRIVPGIEDWPVQQILGQSGRLPQYIIQCIEYLLDDSIISIAGRNTVSITNVPLFHLRLRHLPKSLQDLYASRFDRLGRLDGEHKAIGTIAQQVLLASAFLRDFPSDLPSLGGAQHAPAVVELLRRRSFLAARDQGQPADTHLDWTHESLALFFRDALREYIQGIAPPETSAEAGAMAQRFPEAARALQACQAVFDRLPQLAKGATATVSGDHAGAESYFREMNACIRDIDDFATCKVDSQYYDYIDYAVRAEQNKGTPDAALLARLLPTKAYIGAFHNSLPHADQADKFAKAVIADATWDAGLREWSKFWVDQVVAHVYMDAGLLLEALYRKQEALLALQISPALDADAAAWFEIHDCLRLLYIYANFGVQAERHGKLAEQAAKRVPDGQHLIGMGLGNEALQYFLADPMHCLELNEKSLQTCVAAGEQRHIWHGKASVIACQLKAKAGNDAWLTASDDVVVGIMQECTDHAYYSVMPRLYLLRATLAYLQGVNACPSNSTTVESDRHFARALDLSAQGAAACRRHVIGYILWQLHNLNAVVLQRQGDLAAAARNMTTAVHVLRNEDLWLMGDEGVVSAAPVVLANFLKMKTIPESTKLAELGRFRGYKRYGWESHGGVQQLISCEKPCWHLFASKELPPPGLITDSRTGLGVVCWF